MKSSGWGLPVLVLSCSFQHTSCIDWGAVHASCILPVFTQTHGALHSRTFTHLQARMTIVTKRVQHGLGTRHPSLNPVLVRPVLKWLGPTVLVGLRHLHRFLRHGHAWCLYLSLSVCSAWLSPSRHKLDNVDSIASSALSGVQHIRVLEHKAPLTVYTVWDLESDYHMPRAGTLSYCSKAAGLRGMLAHRSAAGSLPSSCWLLRLL